MKNLVAKSDVATTEINPGLKLSGGFKVPSYRTGLFLDPKGRGTTTGYDQAVALPAMQAGGDEAMFKENNKKFDVLDGAIELKVTAVNSEVHAESPLLAPVALLPLPPASPPLTCSLARTPLPGLARARFLAPAARQHHSPVLLPTALSSARSAAFSCTSSRPTPTWAPRSPRTCSSRATGSRPLTSSRSCAKLTLGRGVLQWGPGRCNGEVRSGSPLADGGAGAGSMRHGI